MAHVWPERLRPESAVTLGPWPINHGRSLIAGGLGFAVTFPLGYKSSQDGLDLSEVHIAIGVNLRASKGEPAIDLAALANQIALAVPAAAAPAHFDLWKGGQSVASADYVRLAVPASEYQELFDDSDRSGYRLEWVEGYTDKGRLLLNTIVLTNEPQREWASHHQMTAAVYRQKSDECREQGFSRDPVDSYLAGSTVFDAAIWVQSGAETHGYHGATAQTHRASFDSLSQERLDAQSDFSGVAGRVACVHGGARAASSRQLRDPPPFSRPANTRTSSTRTNSSAATFATQLRT